MATAILASGHCVHQRRIGAVVVVASLSPCCVRGCFPILPQFCRQEQMLALARSEVQHRFAQWYLEEFRRQIAGEPPQPWDGPYDDSAA